MAVRPSERAFSFIEDFFQHRHRWREANMNLRHGDVIQSLMRQLYTPHFAEAPRYNPLPYGFMSDELDRCELVRVVNTREGATVDLFTRLAREEIYDYKPIQRFREYHLGFDMIHEDHDWKIIRLHSFDQDPETPNVPAPVRDAILARTSSRLSWGELPWRDGPSVSLFERGYTYTDSSGRERSMSVEHIGDLHITSGVIGVGELFSFSFGARDHDFRPLRRRVKPGVYPIEVSGGSDAVRIVFLPDTPVASWHPAQILERDRYTVGADVAMSGIYDAAALMSSTPREIQRYEDILYEVTHDLFLGDPNAPYGVVVSSGLGDGCYPVYWGVSASGEPVCLMIDFMVQARSLIEHACVPLSMIRPGTRYPLPVQHLEQDLIVTWSKAHRGIDLRIECPDHSLDEVSLVGALGEKTPFDSRSSRGSTYSYHASNVRDPDALILLVACAVGWRNP